MKTANKLTMLPLIENVLISVPKSKNEKSFRVIKIESPKISLENSTKIDEESRGTVSIPI